MPVYRDNDNTSTNNNSQSTLEQEAQMNKQFEEQHKRDAQQEYNQAQQQQQEYVQGGFDQHSFRDTFKTNEGNSAEAMMSSVIDTFLKPISTGALNERATRIIEVFKEYYKQAQEANQTMQVDFIQAPGAKISHFYGGFIVTIPAKTPDGKIQVAAHLVIVESKMKLQPRVETLGGAQFVFQNTAGNTVTEDTIMGVEKLVRNFYHSVSTDIVFIESGFTVIPVEVDLDDLTTLHRIVEYTADAAYARLQMYNINKVEDEAIALAKAAAARSVRWTAHIEEKPQNQTDVVGQLIRTDFSIKTTMVPTQTNNQTYQLGALEFGEVNVFCTPIYAEPQQVLMGNGLWGPATSQHYYNAVVIKDFRTGPEMRMSIGSCLMLLATTSAIATNGVWKRAYIPNRMLDATQTDIHDIGAFGYEVPILNPENYNPANQNQAPRREMIKTKTAEFTTDKFNALMNAAFYQDLMYCIDVPDGHYMLGLFVAEARGSVNARAIIGKILNTMTNGKFYEIFPSDHPMFHTDGERVINGYYPNTTTGTLRPLDDVDHLTLLNITSGDSEWIRNWEQFDNSQTPEELRVARRTEIIKTFSGDEAVVKSYSTRVIVRPEFMKALTEALLATNMYPQLQSGMNMNVVQSRASATQFANLVINPMNMPNVYNNGGVNQFGNYQGFGINTYNNANFWDK